MTMQAMVQVDPYQVNKTRGTKNKKDKKILT